MPTGWECACGACSKGGAALALLLCVLLGLSGLFGLAALSRSAPLMTKLRKTYDGYAIAVLILTLRNIAIAISLVSLALYHFFVRGDK